MAEELPPPPIAGDADLHDFAFTPIFRARLFGSSFHARATDAEWRAGVTLWLKSWDQFPAGSLPDDDVDLCRLAELGRDLKTWRKVKLRALHGWFKCSDGRLYHYVVAEGVMEAYERRRSASSKGKAGAQRRWGAGTGRIIPGGMAEHQNTDSTRIAQALKNDSCGMPEPPDKNSCGMAGAMPGDSNRQGQGQGQGQGHSQSAGEHAPNEREHHERFERVRALYPRFANRANWLNAEHMCRLRIEQDGQTWDTLSAAVERYAKHIRARGNEGTQYVLTPQNFFGAEDRPWKQDWPIPELRNNGVNAPTTKFERIRQEQQRLLDETPDA